MHTSQTTVTKFVLASIKAIGFVCVAIIASITHAQDSSAIRLPEGTQPSIGAWFWWDDVLEPDGYKPYLDLFAEHSPYDLLTTSFRISKYEVTNPALHDQVKKAVAYAKERGLDVALDLDVRLAREAFRKQYPDEQQEMLRLRTVQLFDENEVEFAIESEVLRDHMTGNTTPYEPLSGRLVRVYSFVNSDNGIEPDTVKDITRQCTVKVASGKEVRVGIPSDVSTSGRTACVIAAFTLLTPAVYAPHLLEFQRGIIEQYADIALAGIAKDEWGFPPCYDGCPAKNDYWFSTFRADAYAAATGGRDLVRDCLLMYAGERGRDRERQAAINVLLRTSRQRNAAIEDHYYHLAKEFFGPEAAVVTHATWMPFPGAPEFKKNGLDWWAATRDWGQTDETTPFPARTALAKKWGSPVWYNQFYSTKLADYEQSLWTHALGGGRINFHPIYPNPDNLSPLDRYGELLKDGLMRGECRLRLIPLVTNAPVNCPVAVVFGQACAMNWAGPTYEDVGLDVTNALWKSGYYADLIPTSEIESDSLTVDDTGTVHYGAQRYAAVVLYHPEFETPATVSFFQRVDPHQTSLYRVGTWTRDFLAKDYDGITALPAVMSACEDAADAATRIIDDLHWRGIVANTPATDELRNGTACPAQMGRIRLLDGTEVLLSGKEIAAGDPISGVFQFAGQPVSADVQGVLAVRFAPDGALDALVAGGLRSFQGRRCGHCDWTNLSTSPTGTTRMGKRTARFRAGQGRFPVPSSHLPTIGSDSICRSHTLRIRHHRVILNLRRISSRQRLTVQRSFASC